VTVVIGRQNGEGRDTIVHVSARPEGNYWDCLVPGSGVVVREASDEKPLKIFIVGSGDELTIDSASLRSFQIGDGVKIGLARNPKNDRLEAFNLQPGDLPSTDVRIIQGQLRRNSKGFAFVDDAFVAPNVVATLGSAIDEVVAMAVYGKHPKEDRRAWRVISLKALVPTDQIAT